MGTTRTERGAGFAREHRSVELSSEQRTRIHDVFTRDRSRFDRFRVSRVDFDLRPGVRIPRRFHLYTMPSDLVEVVPAYDVAEITALAAATVVWEYLALVGSAALGA